MEVEREEYWEYLNIFLQSNKFSKLIIEGLCDYTVVIKEVRGQCAEPYEILVSFLLQVQEYDVFSVNHYIPAGGSGSAFVPQNAPRPDCFHLGLVHHSVQSWALD